MHCSILKFQRLGVWKLPHTSNVLEFFFFFLYNLPTAHTYSLHYNYLKFPAGCFPALLYSLLWVQLLQPPTTPTALHTNHAAFLHKVRFTKLCCRSLFSFALPEPHHPYFFYSASSPFPHRFFTFSLHKHFCTSPVLALTPGMCLS